MKRILFVDDEANLLDALRRMFRGRRNEWQMLFACSGPEALEMAREAAFDVIVTDMRMPGMDGAELLRNFHEQYPQTVRFVLSGQSEMEAVRRAVPLAHQFLSKPCEPEILKSTLTRALQLKSLVNNEPMQEIIGEIQALPSPSATYTSIMTLLADPSVDLSSVSEIIESDLAMSAKMLQLVNSSFFGLPQNVSDVGQATTFLGLNVIRDLALSIELFRPPPDADTALKEWLVGLQSRSTCIGSIARSMFQDKQRADEAFTAGMLHDIGMLVIATKLPDRFAEVLEVSRRSARPLYVVEQEFHGVTHAEAGAYLLGVWGLPYSIMEVAAYHHCPSEIPQQAFNALTAVHVASALVEARGVGTGAISGAPAQIDLSYLEALGVLDRLGEWEELVDERLTESGREAQR